MPVVTHLVRAMDVQLEKCLPKSPGTQAAKVVSRVDRIINSVVQKRATLMLKLVAEIKYHHVLKRDRQKHLAYMYRQRKSTSKGKRDRYKQWAKACDMKAEAETDILNTLDRLREKLRGDFWKMAML